MKNTRNPVTKGGGGAVALGGGEGRCMGKKKKKNSRECLRNRIKFLLMG
jgi:hypothetical protein